MLQFLIFVVVFILLCKERLACGTLSLFVPPSVLLSFLCMWHVALWNRLFLFVRFYRVGQTQLGSFWSLITNQSNNTRENGKVPAAIYRQQKVLYHFPVCCWIDWLLMIKNCLIESGPPCNVFELLVKVKFQSASISSFLWDHQLYLCLTSKFLLETVWQSCDKFRFVHSANSWTVFAQMLWFHSLHLYTFAFIARKANESLCSCWRSPIERTCSSLLSRCKLIGVCS
jgi:hypothetical protein